jgi:hypothetical protein
MPPKVRRLSLDNPDHMAALLRSGAIWKMPVFWQQAIDAIKAGLVPLNECKDVPPEVRAGFPK